MSDDLLLESELNSAFVAPDRTFSGDKLAPYTEGSRLLCLQVRDDADTAIWFVWSFLYMHILLAKDRAEAIRLAWNKDAFRSRLLEWISDKTEEDRISASNIVGSILEEASKGKVDVVPAPGAVSPPGNA